MDKNRLIRFNEGDTLFHAGETSREMYIIRSGKVKVLIEKDDSLIPLTELGKGHYVGEMSFLTGVKRSATVIAETSVVANLVNPELLEDENLGLSSWAVNIARVLVRRIRSTTDLLGDYLIREDLSEKPEGRRADDLKHLEINNFEELKPGRLYLKGQFTESAIEILKAKIRELKMKNLSPIVLDFSDVIDIDQAGINYLFSLTQSTIASDEKLLIENMQLIRDKVLSIKGLQEILAQTHVPIKRVEKDELLIKQGDFENTMYVVKTGLFKISRATKSGSIDLAEAEAGDVIGEMSLIKEGVRSADVRAAKPGVVHVIDTREFYNNIYNVPGWFMELIKGLVERLRNTNEMLEQISNDKKTKHEPIKKWASPFGVVMDSSRPGRFVVNGVMTLSNLEYLVHLIKLEVKKKTASIVLDLTKVNRIEKESISALLSVYTQLKAKGIYVEIKGPQKSILNLFKQYDIDEIPEK